MGETLDIALQVMRGAKFAYSSKCIKCKKHSDSCPAREPKPPKVVLPPTEPLNVFPSAFKRTW